MIALIDEIFKGTNSKDRIYGATETVKQLSSKIYLLLSRPMILNYVNWRIKFLCANYHFSEYYQDNKIRFDYLIKEKGPVVSRLMLNISIANGSIYKIGHENNFKVVEVSSRRYFFI